MSSELSVRTEFHTHHASPRRLVQELRDLLGPGAQFNVDVRPQTFYRFDSLTNELSDAT
jgi:hypothetical protein